MIPTQEKATGPQGVANTAAGQPGEDKTARGNPGLARVVPGQHGRGSEAWRRRNSGVQGPRGEAPSHTISTNARLDATLHIFHRPFFPKGTVSEISGFKKVRRS